MTSTLGEIVAHLSSASAKSESVSVTEKTHICTHISHLSDTHARMHTHTHTHHTYHTHTTHLGYTKVHVSNVLVVHGHTKVHTFTKVHTPHTCIPTCIHT